MHNLSYDRVREFMRLVWINLAVQVWSLIDFAKVAIFYYSNFAFFKADLSILLMYLFCNPFTLSKRFLMRKGEKNIYAYGETPLTSLDTIVNKCKVSSSDKVYELGSGRGRTCFWLHAFIGCNVVGIEHVPEFVERANRVRKKFKLKGIEFRCEDMLETDFSDASVVYLYGTSYDDAFIEKLLTRFQTLPAGTKIITVSYPLTDYTDQPLFEVMKRFPIHYTWGIADVYLHIKK